MADEIVCPSCRRALTAAVPLGTLVQCPLCEHKFRVGDAALPESAAPAAPPVPGLAEDEDFEDDASHEEEPAHEEPAPLAGKSHTFWLSWLLIGQVVLQGFYLFMCLSEGGRPPFREPGSTMQMGYLFLALVSGILTLVWLANVVSNQPLLGIEGNRLNPMGAVISLLIPVLNLFFLPQIFQELWRSSDPHRVEDTEQWKESPGSSLVVLWWVMLIVVGFLSLCYYGHSSHRDAFLNVGFGENPITEAFGLSICQFSLFATLLQFCLVREIMARQIERQANLLIRVDDELRDDEAPQDE